jgi:glucokinase
MDEHIYREQLIRVITMQTPGTEFWVAKADVRYNDNKKLQFFPVEGPRDQFTSKEEAEVNILEQARKLIDKIIVQ